MRLATTLFLLTSCLVLEVQSATLFVKKKIDSHLTINVQAAERSFMLINKTGSAVSTVSAKQASVSGAQDIALTSAALTVNGSAQVNMNISGNSCVFDLTVVMQNATTKVLRGVDICQTDALTLE